MSKITEEDFIRFLSEEEYKELQKRYKEMKEFENEMAKRVAIRKTITLYAKDTLQELTGIFRECDKAISIVKNRCSET